MNKLKESFWPDLYTIEAARKSLRAAAALSYFVAAVTALLALLSMFGVADLVPPMAIADALLFAVFGFFISQGSRIGAVCGLALYILESIERIRSGIGARGGFVVIMILFTLVFVNGVRAAFALERLRRQAAGTA